MDSTTTTRLLTFLGILLVMALWERLAAYRPRHRATGRRWIHNMGLGLSGVISLQLLAYFLPVAVAAAAAQWASASSIGLFPYLGLGPLMTIGGTIFALDFAIYAQHLLFHKVPALWRLHRVHHTDLELDVTSALRFHPVEILLSMLIKSGVVLLVGASAEGVILFEIILNGMAMFNHANVKLPARLDRGLRTLLVTPDMHRVHHSTDSRETDSNYGFNLSIWDRLFQTYTAQPQRGHLDMEIGLKSFRNEAGQNFPWLLRLPFLSRKTGRSD